MKEIRYLEMFKNEISKIQGNLVWSGDGGKYYLFDRYRIESVGDTFTVYKYNTPLKTFNRLLSAVSWSVADNIGRYDVSCEIHKLDNLLTIMINDLEVRTALGKKSDNSEVKETIAAKIDNKFRQKYMVEAKLHGLYKITKTWQRRGFTNELKRSSSSKSC